MRLHVLVAVQRARAPPARGPAARRGAAFGGGPFDTKERASERVWTNARDMELLSALRHQAPAVPAAVVAERPPPRAPAPHAADGWRARVELEEILTSVPGGSVSPPVIDRLLAWRERR